MNIKDELIEIALLDSMEHEPAISALAAGSEGYSKTGLMSEFKKLMKTAAGVVAQGVLRFDSSG